MRKVLCVLLSIMLVFTSGILTYAKNDKKDDKDPKKVADKVKGPEEKKKEKHEEDIIKEKIKKAIKDLDDMKKLLKELQHLYKKNKKDRTLIFLNGEEIDTGDAPPVIKNGRTLVPVRAISDGLKANVSWNPKTQTVTITRPVYNDVYGVKNMTVEIVIGASTIKVDGANVPAEVPASIINGRTFVPLRLIGEIFKMNFDWDSESKTVIIVENTTTITVSKEPIATATPIPTATTIPTLCPYCNR
ncbi:MAG TPA: copper amine oxidase N-terminal domain-containing protein [Pseudobacteroides sp.]|nr:copper amine oxidase N-terminal domain-containing protein [Pseudobacteroides sp.]